MAAVVLALAFVTAASFICHDAMGAFSHEISHHVTMSNQDGLQAEQHLDQIIATAHTRLTILTFVSMLVFGGGAGYVARKWLPKG